MKELNRTSCGRSISLKLALAGLLVAGGVAGSAEAFEFRCRFVERVGNIDVVLQGNIIDASSRVARNIRLQFGVFDDAAGPAPAGGFVGWNVGTLAVSSSTGNSDERRNPGRLSPFNFASGATSNGNPPLPGGDPFTMLTEIDATLGTQSPIWQCDANGVPPLQPAATVRGLNTYVSVYAFSIDPIGNMGVNYTVTAGGNLIAATDWREVGSPTAPDCGDPADPSDDVPGSVTYAPFPVAPRAFTCILDVRIPGPGAAALMVLGGLAGARRRRLRAMGLHECVISDS